MDDLRLLVFKGTKIPIINNLDSIVLYEDGCKKTNQNSKAELLPPKHFTTEELGFLCLRYGASRITYYTDAGETKENAPYVQSKRYYNGRLSKLIIQYKLQKSTKLLKDIGNEHFLIPIQIYNYNNEATKKKVTYPSIKYLTGTIRENNKVCHIVFSDYDEFSLWCEKNNSKKWEVILVSKYELSHINKKHCIVINPYGNRLCIMDDKKSLFYSMQNKN